MKKADYNPFLICCVLVALVFSLFLNWQRNSVEQVNRTVEMAMEYESIVRLAEREGLPEKTVLEMFRERGVTTLVLFDTTLDKLNNKGLITAFSGAELLRAQATGTLTAGWADLAKRGALEPDTIYIGQGASAVAFNDTEEDLRLRFGDDLVKVVSESPRIIAIRGDLQRLNPEVYGEQRGLWQLDLGISSEELRLAKEMGFMVMARPVNYGHGYTHASAAAQTQIDGFFHRLDQSGALISSFVGSGKTILGYENNLDYVAAQLSQRGITLGMVENVVQLQFAPLEGLVPTAELMNYQVARTYVIDKDEQKKIKVEEALRRWALTDEERNIRINYVKTFLVPEYGKTLLETNLDYVAEITASVKARSFTERRAAIFAVYWPDKLPLAFVAAGIMAGLVLYLNLLVPQPGRRLYLLWGAGTLACSGLIFFSSAVLVRQLLALGAATVFPVLSLSLIMNFWDEYKGRAKSLGAVLFAATWQLALAIALSLVGASFIGALLGDIRFFLEIDIYRGVKLTFVLPLFFMFLLCVKRYALFEGDNEHHHILRRINRLLSKPLTLKLIFGLAVLGVVAWIFIGRSGHTAGVPVPALEIKMRVLLEEVMYARPRGKEFMIGHPAFYLAAFAAYRGFPTWLRVLFILGATIGQGSLVQTFAHMRTPIIMSFIRAWDGYLMGIVIGIIAVIVFAWLYPKLRELQRSYLQDE